MITGTICPICGKEFFPYPEHVYSANGRRYCSWTCYKTGKETKTKTVRKYKAVEQYSANGKYIGEFESANQAAEYIGCCPETIRDACRGRTETAFNFIWKYKE